MEVGNGEGCASRYAIHLHALEAADERLHVARLGRVVGPDEVVAHGAVGTCCSMAFFGLTTIVRLELTRLSSGQAASTQA